ncbi:hypothetical protein C4J81_02725 [Deltaproteobacteria bacterium Smac51]|nr:hypothetical protein C4J81_02725 [Deltaproteobacteria bacterium Smac51]
MRIEDFLSQSIDTKNLKKYQKQPEAATFSLPEGQQDTVTISQQAREAQQSGGYFTKQAELNSQARMEFKAYMDQATGRVPSAPKTPEEKIKELTEKIKKLQSQLSEVMTDSSLTAETRSMQSESINSQINALQAQIDQIGKDMASEAAEA